MAAAARTGQVRAGGKDRSPSEAGSGPALPVSAGAVPAPLTETARGPATARERGPDGPDPEWDPGGGPPRPQCAWGQLKTLARTYLFPWPAAADRRFLPTSSKARRGRGGPRRWRAESAAARGASSALCAVRVCWVCRACGTGLLKDMGDAVARSGRGFRHSGERDGLAQGHAPGPGSRPNGGGPGLPPDRPEQLPIGGPGSSPCGTGVTTHARRASSGRSSLLLGGTAPGPCGFGTAPVLLARGAAGSTGTCTAR
ncbi:hypothetical protein M2161_006871 [Streptomyces sp. SAI-133]|nr:hypothetical protein [Streptomyces sp. SAI-133]